MARSIIEHRSEPAVGRSLLRKEDRPLLTGQAEFVDDLRRAGMLHAAILRSPFASARVTAIDPGPARALDGVSLVLTAGDLPDGGPRIPMRLFPQPELEIYLQRPLASGEVRYVGEPVAIVVAESRYLAEDALELIEVGYEPRDPVLDPLEALEPGAPLVHARTRSNAPATIPMTHGDADAAFANAAHVVEARIACQRHAAVPLETRGLVAELDATSDELTLWGAAKLPHVNRGILARLLDLPEEKLRLVEVAVGGGFGARGEVYPEDFLIPYCALLLGRAVAWTEDRREHLQATNHSREQVHDVALALDADGTFLGLRDRFVNNAGAYIRTHGMTVPGMSAALLPGPYVWPAYACEGQQVVTNKTPAGTYRAPGRYETTLVRERVIDIAARRLAIDPVEIRRRNLVKPEQIPYATGTTTRGHPVVYESGDFPRLLEQACERFGYTQMLEWRAADTVDGRRRGVGVACFVEKAGIGDFEYARVELSPTGAAVVYTGAASLGQGLETVLAQICADALGVDYDDVEVRHGDTRETPEGMGAFGSRATMLGGAAVSEAASALRERLLELAALELEVDAADVDAIAGRVAVRGAEERSLSFAELAASATEANGGASGARLAEEATFRCADMSFPFGVQLAAVEVDVDSGAVEIERYSIAYEVGNAINPMLVDAQLVGGAAQGLGGALFEELAYDADGNLSSSTLMDYLLPTAAEVPEFDVLVTEDAPTPLNPLGAKGAGEGGTSGVGAAIANAVSDALDVEVTRLPLSPDHVFRLTRP